METNRSPNPKTAPTTVAKRPRPKRIKHAMLALVVLFGLLAAFAPQASAAPPYGSTPGAQEQFCALAGGTYRPEIDLNTDHPDFDEDWLGDPVLGTLFSTTCYHSDGKGGIATTNCTHFGGTWVEWLEWKAGTLDLRCRIYNTTIPETPGTGGSSGQSPGLDGNSGASTSSASQGRTNGTFGGRS